MSEQNKKWYTGIDGTEDPWNDGDTPPLNAANLNKIEKALLDFLGSTGVVAKIETFVGYEMNSEDSNYPNTLDGKISTLSDNVTVLERNIDNIETTLGSAEGEGNTVINRLAAVETQSGQTKTTVETICNDVYVTVGEQQSLNFYTKSDAEEKFLLKSDAETEIIYKVESIAPDIVEQKVTELIGEDYYKSSEVDTKFDAVDTKLEKKLDVDEELILYCGDSSRNTFNR